MWEGRLRKPCSPKTEADNGARVPSTASDLEVLANCPTESASLDTTRSTTASEPCATQEEKEVGWGCLAGSSPSNLRRPPPSALIGRTPDHNLQLPERVAAVEAGRASTLPMLYHRPRSTGLHP